MSSNTNDNTQFDTTQLTLDENEAERRDFKQRDNANCYQRTGEQRRTWAAFRQPLAPLPKVNRRRASRPEVTTR